MVASQYGGTYRVIEDAVFWRTFFILVQLGLTRGVPACTVN